MIIFNPIAGHWHFKRAHGGLHPDEGGDIWIARHVAEGLVAKGVTDFNSKACSPAVIPKREAYAVWRTRLGVVKALAGALGYVGVLDFAGQMTSYAAWRTAAEVLPTS